MDTSGDDVPKLALTAIANTNLDGGQIGTKVPRQLVNEKTLPVSRLFTTDQRLSQKRARRLDGLALIGTDENALVAASSRC